VAAGDRGSDGEDGRRATLTISPAPILLASNRPILLAPAMNPLMWNNPATRRNVLQLRRDGIIMIGPNAGEMAEANEAGVGRHVRGPGKSPRPAIDNHAAAAATPCSPAKRVADHGGADP